MAERHPIGAIASGATPYDVLGYLLPGGAAILCCYFFEFWLVRVDNADSTRALLPLYSLFHELANGLANKSWAIAAIFLGIALGGIYVAGHIVASVAAILIDRILVRKGHGYPFNRYLLLDDAPPTPVTKPFYRGFFAWFNVYVLVRYSEIALISSWKLASSILDDCARALAWFLVMMVILKLVLSSKFIMRFAGGDHYKGRLIDGLASVLRLAAVPYNLLKSFLDSALGLHRPISAPLRKQFISAMQTRYSLAAGEWGSDAYWLAALRVRRGGRSLAEPADNWLRLYSFARNLGAAFYLAFLYGYAVLLVNRFGALYTDAGHVTVAIPMAYLLAAFIMLSRYYYLYASYYTKYLIRAFVFLESEASPAREGQKNRGLSSPA